MKTKAVYLKSETVNHIIGDTCANDISECKTRAEVAAVAHRHGYETHIGGHHVALMVFGRRVAIATSLSLPDFN
jgi:hypothetical protein